MLLYGAMRALRAEKQGAQVGDRCAQCHTPRDTVDHTSSVARQGVTCATCHLADAVDPARGGGVAAITFGDAIRGPHTPAGVGAPHPVGPAAPHLADGTTMCLACHHEEKNAAGVPTCTTGIEHSGRDASCASCHMPAVATPNGAVSTRATHRSHRFVGPHAAWEGDPSFLATSVAAAIARHDDTVELTVANLTGHALPTGFPGRMILVKVVGRDAAGAEIWTNVTDDPTKQDPQAVFARAYADADGEPVLAAFATDQVRDSTLRPDERRTLRWTVPTTVRSVEAKLMFRLLAPPAAKAIGLEGAPESEARVFVTVAE